MCHYCMYVHICVTTGTVQEAFLCYFYISKTFCDHNMYCVSNSIVGCANLNNAKYDKEELQHNFDDAVNKETTF